MRIYHCISCGHEQHQGAICERCHSRNIQHGQALPSWYRAHRAEYRDSALLTACAKAGMSAEDALAELATHVARLEKHVADLAALTPPKPLVISKEEVAAIKKAVRDLGEKDRT